MSADDDRQPPDDADAAELRDVAARIEVLEGEFQPGPGPDAGPRVDAQAEAIEAARLLVELAAAGVSQLWPVLSYDADTREQAAQRLAPLTLRPWFKQHLGGTDLLARWAPEIEAGLFFGALVAQSIRTVRADRAAGKRTAPGAPRDPDPYAAAAPAQ